MAVDPISLDDDFAAAVARARQAITSRGEDRVAVLGAFESPLPAEEREAVIALLRDGTYAAAARRVSTEDPDFADQ